MAATPVTPVPGVNSFVTTGGTPVTAIDIGPEGGIITNPATAGDQNLSQVEDLFVDPVGDAGTGGFGTTFRLSPGQSWTAIPGQTTKTSVNAASAGHRFSVVSWKAAS